MLTVAIMLLSLMLSGEIPGWSAARAAAARAPESSTVSLRDWARAKGFAYSANTRDKTVTLSTRWAKVVFTLYSKRAEINGVDMFLSFPVSVRGSAPHLSAKDMEKLIEPILFPKSGRGRKPVTTVAICAGHGGRDPGYRVGAYEEKQFTLMLAKEVAAKLAAAGLRPVMIRDTDVYVSRDDRTTIARRKGADIFVSIHYNSAGLNSRGANGVEVYTLAPAGTDSTNGNGTQTRLPVTGNAHDERNILLAYQVQKAMLRGITVSDRALRRARFEVLRDAAMPAILIEAGFMSNPAEMKRILNPAHRRATAQAIVDGVLAYKRMVER